MPPINLFKIDREKCYQCGKCKKHWGGEYGENNAEECCKMLNWKKINEKSNYWKNIKCDDCGRMMI